MRLKSDLLLLLVTLIWGSAFAVMRVAARYEIIFLMKGSRFLLGGLLLLPFARVNKNMGWRNAIPVVLAGVALYGAAALQQAGLKTTPAGNGGFITILYVVIVPMILWIGWKEKPTWKTWCAVSLAVLGGYLLSTNGTYKIATGDLFIFAGSFFWASHVVIVGKTQATMPPVVFACGQYLVCGILNLITGAFFERPTPEVMLTLTPAILYTAIISIAVGFTLQVIAQKHTPTNEAAIILSLEAAFAALFGWIFLRENLQPTQIGVCALIIAAVLLVQLGGGKMSSLEIS